MPAYRQVACDAQRIVCDQRWKGLLLASTAIVSASVLLSDEVWAQATSGAPAQSATGQFTFNISRQSLSSAMIAFQRVTGMSVLADGSVPQKAVSPGASGALSADDALSQMLAGTGLSYSISGSTARIFDPSGNNAGTTVEGAIALDTIDVSGSGGAQLQGPGWQPAPDEVYETPASVAHINSSTIASYGHDLNDALRSVAGVYTWENAAQPGMAVNIRGLEGMGRVNSTIDGVRQNYRFTGHGPAGYTYVEPSLLAGIDVTKGAVTTTGGAGTLGGGVNYRTLSIDDVLHAHEKTGAQISTTFGGNTSSDVSTMMAGGMRFDVGTNRNGGSVFGAVSGTGVGNYKDGNDNIIANTWRDVNSTLMKLSIAPNSEHRLDLGGILYSTDFRANFYDQSVENTTLTAKYAYTPGNDLIDLRMNASFNRTESQWETYWGGQGQAYPGRLMANEALGVDISNTSRWSFNGYGLTLDYGAEYYRDDFSGNTKSDANPTDYRVSAVCSCRANLRLGCSS